MNLKANAFKVLLAFVDTKHLNEVQLCTSLNHNAGERSAGWECVAGSTRIVVRIAACRRVVAVNIACKRCDDYGSLSTFAHNDTGVSALILSGRNSNNNRLFSLGTSGNVVEIRLECL